MRSPFPLTRARARLFRGRVIVSHITHYRRRRTKDIPSATRSRSVFPLHASVKLNPYSPSSREFVLPKRYFTKTFNRSARSHSRDHSNWAISAPDFPSTAARSRRECIRLDYTSSDEIIVLEEKVHFTFRACSVVCRVLKFFWLHDRRTHNAYNAGGRAKLVLRLLFISLEIHPSTIRNNRRRVRAAYPRMRGPLKSSQSTLYGHGNACP